MADSVTPDLERESRLEAEERQLCGKESRVQKHTRPQWARHVDSGDVAKGALAGAIGGLVASWVMTQFAELWTKVAEGHESQSTGGEHDARDWQERTEDQNATELVAQRLAELTVDRTLTPDELGVAAPLVHYGFGISTAAVYGALVEPFEANSLTGAAFGTAVWLGADNVGVPMLSLSQGPQEYTAETYAQGFATHLVYGVTTELVRGALRRLL